MTVRNQPFFNKIFKLWKKKLVVDYWFIELWFKSGKFWNNILTPVREIVWFCLPHRRQNIILKFTRFELQLYESIIYNWFYLFIHSLNILLTNGRCLTVTELFYLKVSLLFIWGSESFILPWHWFLHLQITFGFKLVFFVLTVFLNYFGLLFWPLDANSF